MVSEEIETFERLKEEFKAGGVTKKYANRAKDVYNKYNDHKIENCMCNKIRRMILAETMLKWYESQVG